MKNYFLFFAVFLVFVQCIPFPWSNNSGGGSGSITSVQSVPSNSSTCPGGIDLIINGITYPCIGGVGSYPTTGGCPDGLTGISLNSTLVCGVIGKNIPAGNGTNCAFGGFEFISNTINQTLCYDDPNEEAEIATIIYNANVTSYEVTNIISQLNSIGITITSLTNQILVLNNQMVILSANTTDNTNQIIAIQGSITIIQGQIANLYSLQSNLTAQLSYLTFNVTNNYNDIQMIKYNDSVNFASIFSTLANHTAYLNYLNSYLLTLQGQLNAQSIQIFNNTQSIISINNNISVILNNIDNIFTSISNIQNQLNALILEDTYQNAEIAVLQYNMTVANGQITDLYSIINGIQTNITGILYSINHINDRFVNSSSFTFNIGPNNTVSGSVYVGVNSATSGGYDLWNSANGAIVTLKQLFGITNFLDFTSTPTGLQLVSFLAATNLPYTTFNPSLYPDCAGSTLISQLLDCLAGRTLSSVTNITNAANVMFTPSHIFRNLTEFSVAYGFNIIFDSSLPQFTRNVYVDCTIGDVLGNGASINPFGGLIQAMNSIGLTLFNQAVQIIVNGGACNEVGDLLFKPNVFIKGSNSRVFQYNLTGNVYLDSSWSYFAGSHVEGGMDGIYFNANMINLNFTGMGAAGVNSKAKFSFSQSEIDSTIYVDGRGNSDFFHVNTVDLDKDVSLNCANSHIEACSGIVGNILISDYSCNSVLLNEHLIFNYFENSNYTIIQSTSNIILDAFLNGWDSGYFILQGNLTVNTYTIPVRLLKDNSVNIVFNLNLAGSVMCDLPSYFSSPCLNTDQIVFELMSHARMLKGSNTGIPLLFYSNSTTDILNDLDSSSVNIPITSSNGTITIGFIDPTTQLSLNGVNCYNNSGNIICDSIYIPFNSSADCPTGGIMIQTKSGNYPFCFPYDFNATDVGFSFSSDRNLNITNLGGLNYFISFISNLYSTNPAFLNITNLADGNIRFAINTPLLTGDSFINVVQNGINYTLSWTGGFTSDNTNLLTISTNATSGLTTFHPIDLTSNFTGVNNRNCLSHNSQVVCDVLLTSNAPTALCPTGLNTITSIDLILSFCNPFPDNISTLNMSLSSGNAYLSITNSGGLNWLFTDVTNYTSTNPTFLQITQNATTGQVIYNFIPPTIVGDSFINVTQNGTVYSLVWNGQIISSNTNLLTVSFNRTLGTYTLNPIDSVSNSTGVNGRNCLTHNGQTICDNFLYLNSTGINVCPLGFVTIVSISGNFSFCTPYATINTLIAGNAISLTQGSGFGNYTINVIGSTISTIYSNVSNINCGAGSFIFTINGANFTSCYPFADADPIIVNISSSNCGVSGAFQISLNGFNYTACYPFTSANAITAVYTNVSVSNCANGAFILTIAGVNYTSCYPQFLYNSINAGSGIQINTGSSSSNISIAVLGSTVSAIYNITTSACGSNAFILTIGGANYTSCSNFVDSTDAVVVNITNSNCPAGAFQITYNSVNYTTCYPASTSSSTSSAGCLFYQTGGPFVVPNPGTTVTSITSGLGRGSVTVAPNTFINGSRIVGAATGLVSAAAGRNLQTFVTLGGTTICSTASLAFTTTPTNQPFKVDVDLIINKIGSSGLASCSVVFTSENTATRTVGNELQNTATGAIAVNTTSALTFDVSFQYSNGNVANTWTTKTFNFNLS